MLDRTCRRAALLAAFALLGCAVDAAPGPVAGYPFAYAMDECGPADGPAVTVYLSGHALDTLPPEGGHLAVMLWVGRDETMGRTFRSSDQPLRGTVLECGAPGACNPLAAWRVTMRSFARDTLDGSVDFQLGTRVVAGSFQARWRDRKST